VKFSAVIKPAANVDWPMPVLVPAGTKSGSLEGNSMLESVGIICVRRYFKNNFASEGVDLDKIV
jgi:hypothetical protein